MTEKTPNHELSPQRCPVNLADVDRFAAGAQEHWYEAYPILHDQAPVLPLPGEGKAAEAVQEPGAATLLLCFLTNISRSFTCFRKFLISASEPP